MSKIFVLSSPSGSGKTTLRDIALEKINSLNKIITMTSRSPRGDEVDGVDYYFRTKEEMSKLNETGEMVEMVETYGNLYGTPKFEIDKYITADKNIIVILDAFGKVKFDQHYETVGIFIMPPDEKILRERLRNRWAAEPNEDDINELEKRINRSNEEVKYARNCAHYKYTIDGTMNIKECADALIYIINDELYNEGNY